MGRTAWYVKRKGNVRGPFSSDQIRIMVASGEILPTDKLRKSGFGAWRRAGKSHKLFPPAEEPDGSTTEARNRREDPVGGIDEPDDALRVSFDAADDRGVRVDLTRVAPPASAARHAETVHSPAHSDGAAHAGRSAARDARLVPFAAMDTAFSRLVRAAGIIAKVAVMAAGGAGLWAGYEYRRAISSWLWPPPFPLVTVSGDVAYEDGTRLPTDELFIAFHPERQRRDARTFPRPAYARVDPRTGRFSVAGDGRAFGGVVEGENRVTLHVRPPAPLPAHIAGEAYDTVATTPLVVEVDGRPLPIRIARPVVVADEE